MVVARRWPVGVPASFSRRGGLSLGVVFVTASAVGVVVWVVSDIHCRLSFACSLVFTACIILSNAFFASQNPSSRPKFFPSSIPSSCPFLLSSYGLLHRPGPCPSASHLPRSSDSPSLVPSSIPFSRSSLDVFSSPLVFPTRYPSSFPSRHPFR
ncbi:hypothetical protein L208DRAFT_167730 [Tricholoma matsutake]|nr:hypothetical protein L208DRAFT_167730 [Tricholoma matsutake 945]